MSIHIVDRVQKILLCATSTAVKNVVPLNLTVESPRSLTQSILVNFGVLIGITGDIKGKLVLTGDSELFGSIGEVMFGMQLENEIMVSFSGELGNMIAGGIASSIFKDGIQTDITAPTILSGNTSLSGYRNGLHIPVYFESVGRMGIHLLLD